MLRVATSCAEDNPDRAAAFFALKGATRIGAIQNFVQSKPTCLRIVNRAQSRLATEVDTR
jgi:hypothetical protein